MVALQMGFPLGAGKIRPRPPVSSLAWSITAGAGVLKGNRWGLPVVVHGCGNGPRSCVEVPATQFVNSVTTPASMAVPTQPHRTATHPDCRTRLTAVPVNPAQWVLLCSTYPIRVFAQGAVILRNSGHRIDGC